MIKKSKAAGFLVCYCDTDARGLEEKRRIDQRVGFFHLLVVSANAEESDWEMGYG
jgi:hypothetical protein